MQRFAGPLSLCASIFAKSFSWALALLWLCQTASAQPWQNPTNPLDVSADTAVSPIDVLLVANALNGGMGGPLASPSPGNSPPPYYDANADGDLTPLDALIVLNYLNDDADNADVIPGLTSPTEVGGPDVAIRIRATDLSHNPLFAVNLGEEFLIEALVLDLRPAGAEGVFAAYVDMVYDPALTAASQTIEFSPSYTSGTSGDFSTPGLVDEAGGFSGGLSYLGPGERSLFTILFRAEGLGVISFALDPADLLPAHDVLLHAVDSPVAHGRIAYVGTSVIVTAVPEPSSVALLVVGAIGLVAGISRRRRRVNCRA